MACCGRFLKRPPELTAELSELARIGKVASGPDAVARGGCRWEYSWIQPICVASGLMALQQFTGINAVNMFAGTILSEAGVGSADAAALTLAATHIIGTSICIWIIDSMGRRPLLALAAGGMGAAAAALWMLGDGVEVSATVRVVLLVLYILSFALGVGALPFLMVAEILPQPGDVWAPHSQLPTPHSPLTTPHPPPPPRPGLRANIAAPVPLLCISPFHLPSSPLSADH